MDQRRQTAGAGGTHDDVRGRDLVEQPGDGGGGQPGVDGDDDGACPLNPHVQLRLGEQIRTPEHDGDTVAAPHAAVQQTAGHPVRGTVPCPERRLTDVDEHDRGRLGLVLCEQRQLIGHPATAVRIGVHADGGSGAGLRVGTREPFSPGTKSASTDSVTSSISCCSWSYTASTLTGTR